MSADLDELATAAALCTRCDLFRDATQTVFGKGASKARLMLVGEQPGDVEDRRDEPFVGPAGTVLWTCGPRGISAADIVGAAPPHPIAG